MSATKQHHHDAIEAAMRQPVQERPILFSAPMVRAIMDGRKTQTRRLAHIFNNFNAMQVHCNAVGEFIGWSGDHVSIEFTKEHYPKGTGIPYPHGKIGDRLWVRETWACVESQNVYRADFGPEPVDWNWRPSIHMPRAASRITLEITGIRVERLNDISKSDAVAEGIESFRPVPGDGPAETIYKDYTGKNAVPYFITDPRESFRTLWESINAPGSWGKNPWVWVIDFQDLRNFISPT